MMQNPRKAAVARRKLCGVAQTPNPSAMTPIPHNSPLCLTLYRRLPYLYPLFQYS
jgi:hypothetical protein